MRTDEDLDAWFSANYVRLRRFAAVVAPPATAPDDLLQDALVRILRRGGIADLQDPNAYLCRTMTNLASDRRRRWHLGRAAHRRLGPSATEVESVYPSDLSDLSLLTPRERGAVYLHDVEGLPFDEVAALLDCSPQNARQAAVRGRDHLRKTFEVGR